MFGSHRRCVRRCECETLMPKPGPLPHTSHTAATPNTTCREFTIGHVGPVRAVVTGPTRAGQPPQGTDLAAGSQIRVRVGPPCGWPDAPGSSPLSLVGITSVHHG